jgi:hypothetical protein
MSVQITMQGTVKADGTLELDEPVAMPEGRVLVTVQPIVQPAPDDPFWQRMERIWAGQRARGHVPRSVEDVESGRQAFRQEMEEEIQEAMRLQEECRRAREQANSAQEPDE